MSVKRCSADLLFYIHFHHIVSLCSAFSLSVCQMTMSLQGLDGTEAATVGELDLQPQPQQHFIALHNIKLCPREWKKPPSVSMVVAMAMHNYLLAHLSLMCGNYVHNRFSSLFLPHCYCRLFMVVLKCLSSSRVFSTGTEICRLFFL